MSGENEKPQKKPVLTFEPLGEEGEDAYRARFHQHPEKAREINERFLAERGLTLDDVVVDESAAEFELRLVDGGDHE